MSYDYSRKTILPGIKHHKPNQTLYLLKCEEEKNALLE
jgi:hypothetical protein